MLLAVALVLGVSPDVFAGSVKIADYPTMVRPGEVAEVEVIWDDIPVNKGYMLRVQLENWDVDPGICVVKDVTEFLTRGRSKISLPIPNDIKAVKGARFVAAFISQVKNWDDALCTTFTKKDVTIKALLEILDYPKLVFRGDVVQVKVRWEGIPIDKDYLLHVQLENWDVEPGIVVIGEIDDFQSEGDTTVSLRIPTELDTATGCRFVAAFISRLRGWEDTFYVTFTDKDAEIR